MKAEILHLVITKSFLDPTVVPTLVERQVMRNRSLRSSERRELSDLIYDSIRWRRRIWGDIVPTRTDWQVTTKVISEAKLLRANPPLAKWSSLQTDALARELSFPTWIIDHWIKTFGFQSTVSLALASNDPAPVTLRANILKKSRAELKKILEKEDVDVLEGQHCPWALHLKSRRNLQALRSYRSGFFEVQDEGSQVSVYASGALPNQLVVDACTGAGGKALALAAMMENKGQVVAVDTDARKFTELKKRAKRNGVKNIITKWTAQDDPNVLPDLRCKADLVFVDAPCSSFGAFRRRPWMKWEITANHILKIVERQKKILSRFAELVKVGGIVEYVTCTLHAAENDDVIVSFLESHPSFSHDQPTKLLRPDIEGTDGFTISKLRRN